MRADNVTGPITYHGEGPCWSPSWGGLRFVDLYAGDLLTIDNGKVTRLNTGEDVASFVRPREHGGYVVGTRQGIGLAESADTAPSARLLLMPESDLRMNDGGITPDGRLLAGSMSADGSPTGCLYLVEPDLSYGVAATNVGCSNGIAFSVAGDRAYYVDTVTSRIDEFDYQNGSLIGRRPFVTIDPEIVYPDGLTVDSLGNVWVAVWGAGEVHAYDREGTLLQIVELPTRHVSACAFGDDDLSTLYITTSQERIDTAAEPEAGSLFSVRPGVAGPPVVPFLG